MTPSIVIAETCHYCSKGCSPVEILRLPGGIRMCHSCYRQHTAGVLAMSGLKANADGSLATTAPPPSECSECHTSIEELRLQAGKRDLPMAIHFEGGVYRFLCVECDAKYVPKRKDLYADTEFGWKEGLK